MQPVFFLFIILTLFVTSCDTDCSPPVVPSCPDNPKIHQLGLCFDTNDPNPYALLLAIVGFTIFLGLIILVLDKKTKQHPSYLPIVNKVYRELMLLGIISFLLFVVESVDSCELKKVLDVEAFEWTHYLVFLISLFYIATVLFLLVLVKVTYTKWKKMQELTPDQTKRRLLEAERSLAILPWYKKIFAIREYWEYRNATDSFLFLHARTSFLMRFHEAIFTQASHVYQKKGKMVPSKAQILEDFDFVRFIRKSARHILLELLELPASLVGILIGVVVIQIIRLSISGGSVSLGVIAYIIGGGYVVLVPSFTFLFFALWFNLSRYRKDVNLKANNLGVDVFLNKFADAFKEQTREADQPRVSTFRRFTTRINSGSVSLAAELSAGSQKAWKVLGPHFFFKLLQFLTYWQCIYISVVILYIQIQIDSNIYYFFTWFPPIFVFVFALPRVVPMYTILYCLAEETHQHEKKEKERYIKEVFQGHFSSSLTSVNGAVEIHNEQGSASETDSDTESDGSE